MAAVQRLALRLALRTPPARLRRLLSSAVRALPRRVGQHIRRSLCRVSIRACLSQLTPARVTLPTAPRRKPSPLQATASPTASPLRPPQPPPTEGAFHGRTDRTLPPPPPPRAPAASRATSSAHPSTDFEVNRTQLVFTVGDGPGALQAAVALFGTHGVNMTRIESRPSKGPL